MAALSLEGKTLGKYRVLEPLGKGGMARVYRAYHPTLNRYVAIKVLRSDLVEDEEFLARFRREAQSVASLRHKNIVQVFDFDVQDELYFMVMELMEGDSLKKRLNAYRIREQHMPLSEVAHLMLDVLDGLAYAHKAGVIHRDIKPGNILLTEKGEAVLSDFGIARMMGATQHTVSGALMGTLSYMAPEQGLHGHCDECSDLYSLGIVLYEALTQRPPFEGDTPLAVLMKHINDPLPPPSDMNPGLPAPLEDVVLKTLAKSPEDRFQTAPELSHALQEALKTAGVEISGKRPTPLSPSSQAGPSESVVVLSGSSRDDLQDREFAADDTDQFNTSDQNQAFADVEPQAQKPGREMIQALTKLGGLVIGAAANALNEIVDTFETPDTTSRSKKLARGAEDAPTEPEAASPEKTWTIFRSIAALLLANSFLILIASITGLWNIYAVSWPMELFLAAGVLSAIMVNTESFWVMLPTGLLAGNGAIFLYCTTTQLWEHWRFLWVFEVWLVFGLLWWVIKTARQQTMSRHYSIRIGNSFGVLLTVISFSSLGLGVILAAASKALDWFL